VGMAQASTEHVSRAGVSKVENSSSKPWHGLAVLKLKWPACMSRGRSAARDRAGAVHRHATLCHYLSRSVSRTCHGPDSRPRGGPPPASARESQKAPDNQILRRPESMSRCIEFACDAKRWKRLQQHNMLAST
jgi:hypothetical protein